MVACMCLTKVNSSLYFLFLCLYRWKTELAENCREDKWDNSPNAGWTASGIRRIFRTHHLHPKSTARHRDTDHISTRAVCNMVVLESL